jgi:phospholipid/cholesterol/gamma-HCH transport system substrate-binding protein
MSGGIPGGRPPGPAPRGEIPGGRRPGPAPRGGRARWLTALAASTVLAVAALTGCSSSGFSGIYSITLPGGANLGSHPYQVTAQFQNVVDLVPQSAVRVNDVAVGRVTRIWLPRGSWTANVTMLVNGAIHLPANAIAQVTQSSLLGEQYVALSAPPGIPPQGQLRSGSVIPVTRTTTNATVEEVLGALSLLLNGGGISQLHTITVQLDAALTNNEPQIRSMVARLDTLLANLNSHKQSIETALDGLNSLSATLAARDRQISTVLDNLTPGLQVLNDERAQLVTMLQALQNLTGVAVSTINAGQATLVRNLQALEPTLKELANAGANLPDALQVLLTYPFTDQVLKDIKGDYLNLYLSVQAAKGTQTIAPVTIPSPKGTP